MIFGYVFVKFIDITILIGILKKENEIPIVIDISNFQ